jgi:uncharacterized cupin superfamily protein
MLITRKGDATYVAKPDGTNVWYYLFREYEVHYNEIVPGVTQVWHCHELIEEVIFMLTGQLLAEWIEDGKKQQSMLKEGDLVQSKNSVHTFTNTSEYLTKFLVIKLVVDGNDHRKTFKDDKRVFSVETLPLA